MTPFRFGLPVDTVPHVEMTPDKRAPLIAKMQCWMGMLNWLQQCTLPDLAMIFSLLASHMHCPRVPVTSTPPNMLGATYYLHWT